MDAKNMHGIKAKQEMNDSPSGLLDGDGHLRPRKRASRFINQPCKASGFCSRMQRSTEPESAGSGKWRACNFPIQTNPGCIIDSFGFHFFTPFVDVRARRLGPATILIEESSDGTTSEYACRTKARRAAQASCQTVKRLPGRIRSGTCVLNFMCAKPC